MSKDEKKGYDDAFFRTMTNEATVAAHVLLPIVLKLLKPASIVDVGCGEGGWLKVASELGVSDIFGVDGPWLDVKTLKIPREKFQHVDLAGKFSLGRKFDVAMTLEVAEHLPPAAAADFVDSVAALSNVIVFSAAIPNQGGVGHVNEQWPAYWSELFRKRDYRVIDCLRASIWNQLGATAYYAQNVFVYAHSSVSFNPQLPTLPLTKDGHPMALVHPETFTRRANLEAWGLKVMFRAVPGMIGKRIKRRFRKK